MMHLHAETLMWYDKPAQNWNEALPVGNGRLGGMVFGNVEREQIQFNEDSIWSGGPRNRNNPDAKKHLPVIRKLLFEGKVTEAQQLAEAALSGTPQSQRTYLNAGQLFIRFHHPSGKMQNYERMLDLDQAIAVTNYNYGSVRYQREVFCSYPDQVMVIQLKADQPEALSFTARFEREKGRHIERVFHVESDTIVMNNVCGGKDGISYTAAVKALTDGGTIRAIGEHLIVEQATEVTLLLTVASTFRFDDPEAQCMHLIKHAVSKGYDRLRKEHIEDYQALFHRVKLSLEPNVNVTSSASVTPVNERLERIRQGEEDNGLVTLYFHFSRYLLIASSRPGSLPANLQGIWNHSMSPPWDSKYTININTEMNYWPAEVCNLSECHEPLFEQIERMKENGRVTAQTMYGCRGFVCHHNTDIWADTAPQDIFLPATYWVTGAAWLTLHLWEHYQFSRDQQFLERAYETMKEAVLFFMDFLVESPEGYLVTCPSVSPENSYILPNGEKGALCYGPYMDTQILLELISACIEASKILGKDEDQREQWEAVKSRLPEMKIGKYGQLQEWIQDYEEAQPGHRHISHLFGLHPGTTISPAHTPALAKAAKITLERRLANGGGHTGWSRAWIINFWARLLDGEQAYLHTKELLRKSTLPNLLDNHPPFQIDGNFGAAAGIAEMLVQSHLGYVHLFPALPSVWSNGCVSGLRVRGGFELELQWENQKLTKAVLQSLKGNVIRIQPGCQVRVTTMNGTEITAEQKHDGMIEFATNAGESYLLQPTE